MAGGAEGSVIVGSPDAPAVTIASADLAAMEQLRSLWADFYAEQKSMGLLAPIPADGFDRWVQSFAGTLGRQEDGIDLVGLIEGVLQGFERDVRVARQVLS